MKPSFFSLIAGGLALAALPDAAGADPVREVVEAGECRTYLDADSIEFVNGFWAQPGSVVAATIEQGSEQSDDLILAAVDGEDPCSTSSASRVVGRLKEGEDYSGSPDFEAFTADEAGTLVSPGKGADLPNAAKFYAVTGIYIDEAGDNPCQIKLFGRMIDPRYGDAHRLLAQYLLDGCGAGTGFGELVNPDLVQFKGPDNRFIRSAQVCMGESRIVFEPPLATDPEKLKGLRIQASAVSAEGVVDPRNEVKEYQQRHCDHWAGRVACPADQIVTGVMVYRLADTFAGLGLRCQKVRMVVAPRVLTKDETGY